MQYLRRVLLLLLVYGLVLGTAYAEPEGTPGEAGAEVQMVKTNLEKSEIDFNINAANQRFDAINLKLSTQDLRSQDLQVAISEIEGLKVNAETCVKQGDAKIEEISNLVKSSEIGSANAQQRNDLKYLTNKKSEVSSKTSECRLFTFRAQEAIIAFKKTVQALNENQTFERNYPVWEVFQNLQEFSVEDIDVKKIMDNSGIQLLNRQNLYFFQGMLLIGLLMAVYVRIRCIRSLRQSLGMHPLYDSFLQTMKLYIFPIIIFGVLSVYLSVIHDMNAPTAIELLSKTLLCYSVTLAGFRILLASTSHRSLIAGIHYYFANKLYSRIFYVGALIVFGLIFNEIMHAQNQLTELMSVLYMCYTMILAFGVTWLFWLFNIHPKIQKNNHVIRFVFKSSLVVFLLAILIINFVGYHKLVFYILSSLLYTAGLLSVLLALIRFTYFVFKTLDESRNQILLKIWHSLGTRRHPDLIEIHIIRIAVFVTIYFSAFLTFLKIWGGASLQVDRLTEIWQKGFMIASMNINPSRLVIAALVFSSIHLLTRYLATKITHKNRFDGEKDTQVALASITGYIGFALAISLALLVSGVDLSGIALIAGALSVGIGLGLQGIVNNFISGIILLLEKPIKPGDRITMGGVEGFVKKIRIRSTRITTVYNEDIIVPNSELISNKVTNYMYHDRSFILTVPIEVAYDSDPKLVMKILQDIARAHPEVVATAPENVSVLLTRYADSNIVFELYCMITDVNRKAIVTSDIRISVLEEFKKHGIEISFTVRNVNIKCKKIDSEHDRNPLEEKFNPNVEPDPGLLGT